MISVIVPMYNSKSTIVDCLNSIKNQTKFNEILEIIVVNDGSKDESLSIVKKYIEENINMNIILINKINGGVSTARNAGMKVAKGKYIALLDSDDIWLPNKIERQLDIMLSNPEIDFLGCDSDNKGLSIMGRKIDRLYKANISDLCIKCFPATSTAIFKRKIIEKIGYFDENQKYGEDMNYFNKICINFQYYHLPEYLLYFGHGKPRFGYSGLSANLEGMHKGNLKNIKELKEDKQIGKVFYILMYIFYWLKYFRRICISKLR